MASTSDSGFSPFGIALFAVAIVAIAFFAFLMTERGDGRDSGRMDSPREIAARSGGPNGDRAHEASPAVRKIRGEAYLTGAE